MRIVQVNAAYDASIKTADALLDTYHTLTEWSVAMRDAGASVVVIQRFHTAAKIVRDGIQYHFVVDRDPPWLSTTAAPQEFVTAVVHQPADLIHVNGLIFPALVGGIRAALGRRCAIVVQHHGGEFDAVGEGADDQGRGDHREGHLEHEVNEFRNHDAVGEGCRGPERRADVRTRAQRARE